MKIGVVIDQLLAGGVQLSAIEQVKQLIRNGHEVRLLILMRRRYDTDFSYLVASIPHQYLSDSYPRLFRQTHKFPFFTFLSTLHLASPFLAPRVIKHDHYDILLSLGTTTCLTTQAIFHDLAIPYIAVIHDPIVYILDKVYAHTPLRFFFFLLKPLAHYFESLFVKNAAATIVISQVHQRYLESMYHIHPILLGFGCYPQKHLPSKRGSNLLSFGRWEKGKHPETLLYLLKSLPGAQLIIAGTWTQPADLIWFRNLIKLHDLSSRVKLVTHYSNNQSGLSKLCAQSRVWIHPNFEAFGLAALEAASHGLPIIIPAGSGVTSGFKHGVDGFFPPSANPADYLPFIKRLLVSERLAYHMGKNAWLTTLKRHSWSAQTRQLEKIITSSLRPSITVIETGHATGTTLAGGDKLMEPMFDSLYRTHAFTIIVSTIGASHWLTNPHPKRLLLLPPNRFDANGQPVPVFITYCARIIQTTYLLLTLPHPRIIYSSTNVLPDVLPAFVLRLVSPHTKWIARIHHLIEPPSRRPGRLYVNFGAYVLQLLCVHLIKHHADVTLALNTSLANNLIDYQGFHPSRIFILGAGIDQKKIASFRASASTHKFDGIFVGRFHSSKGIFDLTPIWRQVTAVLPTATLAVVGTGFEYVKSSFKSHPNIHVLGQVSENRKLALLKNSKVFLFTDHEAGWGIAVAEAMAAGVPVVGYDIGILGTVFTQGYLTAPLGNYSAFADQIIRLLTHRRLASSYALEARQQSRSLDWSITAKKFKIILHATLA